jgi:hypothetical protein
VRVGGLRIATVTTVGTATIAAAIGSGGVPAALLALAARMGFGVGGEAVGAVVKGVSQNEVGLDLAATKRIQEAGPGDFTEIWKPNSLYKTNLGDRHGRL